MKHTANKQTNKTRESNARESEGRDLLELTKMINNVGEA